MDPKFFRKYADLITEASVEEAMPAANAQVNPQSTNEYGMKILGTLNKTFDNAFDFRNNQDGSFTVVQRPKTGPTDIYDPQHENNPYVLTPQNMSKVLDPYYNMFRQKGWRFDQPSGGQFTIAVTQ